MIDIVSANPTNELRWQKRKVPWEESSSGFNMLQFLQQKWSIQTRDPQTGLIFGYEWRDVPEVREP